LAIALLAAFLFPPTISHIQLGQFSTGITLIFLVVAIWQDKMPTYLASLLLAIALAKPQLAIFVLPGLLLSRYTDKGVRDTVLFVALLLASVLVLTIPLFVAYPAWFIDFVMTLQENPAWQQPSSLTILTSLSPSLGLFLWIALAVVGFLINIQLWLKLPVQKAVLWSLALTPLVTPYVWSWDFVMILPLFISSLFQIKAQPAFWLLVLGYAICWGLIIRVAYSGALSNFYYWWVPWFLAGIIVGATIMEQPSKLLSPFRNKPPGADRPA
jgi:hypothetical protein